jgi:hypothetical protein
MSYVKEAQERLAKARFDLIRAGIRIVAMAGMLTPERRAVFGPRVLAALDQLAAALKALETPAVEKAARLIVDVFPVIELHQDPRVLKFLGVAAELKSAVLCVDAAEQDLAAVERAEDEGNG